MHYVALLCALAYQTECGEYIDEVLEVSRAAVEARPVVGRYCEASRVRHDDVTSLNVLMPDR